MAPDYPDIQLELGVSDFIAITNQVLEGAMRHVAVVGELANFRISNNRWVFFDLKDEVASLRCFGTVYSLPGPIEPGMLLKVGGQPKLSPKYGFSLNIESIQPVGEGSLKKAAELLQAKLMAEGLFAPERKRPLPYPPERIGIITSAASAAYADFIKIIGQRWAGLEITLADVQVQGEPAVEQIVRALNHFNQLSDPPDVLVLTRGGGSPEDLWAFSSEPVTRAVAASRVPTLVAIGHEVDICLAELAADSRASTPSNAAELLTPDRRQVLLNLHTSRQALAQGLHQTLAQARRSLRQQQLQMLRELTLAARRSRQRLGEQQTLLNLLNPLAILSRGFAIVRGADGQAVRLIGQIRPGEPIDVQLADGRIQAEVQ